LEKYTQTYVIATLLQQPQLQQQQQLLLLLLLLQTASPGAWEVSTVTLADGIATTGGCVQTDVTRPTLGTQRQLRHYNTQPENYNTVIGVVVIAVAAAGAAAAVVVVVVVVVLVS